MPLFSMDLGVAILIKTVQSWPLGNKSH